MRKASSKKFVRLLSFQRILYPFNLVGSYSYKRCKAGRAGSATFSPYVLIFVTRHCRAGSATFSTASRWSSVLANPSGTKAPKPEWHYSPLNSNCPANRAALRPPCDRNRPRPSASLSSNSTGPALPACRVAATGNRNWHEPPVEPEKP